MKPARTKAKLVISDFHLARGRWLPDGRRNPLEDFHQDEKFREMLEHYSHGTYADADVELIVNGDFFDPLAVLFVPDEQRRQRRPEREFPIEVEENAAVRQFQRIIAGHPIAIGAMRDFLARGKRIIFRWGNHDAALLWPKVQAYLREVLSPPTDLQIEFQLEPYVFDGICIDHGHQYEALNQFDENNIFIERRDRKGQVRRIQNLPFGSFFVMGLINRIKLERRYISQVQPFRTYLAISFFIDPIFFVTGGLRSLWFFVKMRFITHPKRFARFRKTLLLIGEVFRRKSLEDEAEKFLKSRESTQRGIHTLILGHNHQATTRIFPGGKQYINTGTWTPITSLDMGSLGHRVKRTYALIEYVDGKPRASLKVWNGKTAVTEDFE
jgi:UDP-2,3-diacylglucosamine pyrophosphatase LpxH